MKNSKKLVARRRFLQGMLASPLLASVPYAYGQQTAIKVGGTLPLTGPLGSTGLVHKIAQEIFVEQINKRGGLLGRPVELILLDDQSQAANTRTLYERLITAEKVDFLMGPYATSSILAAMGVAQRYGKLFIQSSLGDPTLATYDMQFPALPLGPNPRQADAEILFDAWASTPRPPQSISIVTSKFPSALDISKGAREVAEKRGMTVKLFLEYEFGTKDFGPIASRVKDANSDLFWMGSLGLEGNQFIDSMKKLDYLPPRQFYLFPAPGPMASNPSADRATSLTWFEEHAPFDKNPGAADLIAKFGERARASGLAWPHVDYQAAAEFAAWQILEGAVVATKSLDDKVLAGWLKKNEVVTVLGRQKFDGPNNGGPERTCIKQIRDGKWNVVWPVALSAPGQRLEGPG
jgi:branched-chain amino acid transport system substrate-binding protein